MRRLPVCRLLAGSILLSILVLAQDQHPAQETAPWTENAANQWYATQSWLVGSNYLPAYADNELQMWQADTFDARRIDLELGWAQGLGMNTMRVFLHDLLWKQDSDGFKN